MDRWRAMKIFVRVAEARSFTRAADHLQLPRSTVSATVRQLETHLGVRLLFRTTRTVSLTLDGEAYLARCQELLDALEETEALFQQRISRPRGRLRVDLPGRIARLVVIPALRRFIEQYPEIELELGVTDRRVDLVQEGVDCAVRVGIVEGEQLVARQIGLLEQGSFASPKYLAEHGVPESISDLSSHFAINYATPMSSGTCDWEYTDNGQALTIPVPSAVCVNNAEAYIACARSGLGLIQVPRYDTRNDVRNGRLVEVLAGFKPPPMPITVLYAHRGHMSRRVRAYVDWLTELFRETLWPETAEP